ncbi:hypothetical protein B5C34_08925 [Pacificimonas flava]|uniref:Uncharacterized protein n=2 Tax=Pacificimonas TaxID=1960290 RepID=A0A219B5K9_9SPHN|nr:MULTISPECIES: FliH/SctL family protein [Pacificimonas]MBZ6379210.1 flagellar assembly protein FliH [Pacificimonas aurantium]OWV33571.1 hypothetical protein B5C34_08925 [Pacificimonas flava]
MSSALSSSVRKFEFDRIFSPAANTPASTADLHLKLAESEAELTRLKREMQDHQKELERVRAEAFEAGAAQERAKREEDMRLLARSVLDQLCHLDDALDSATVRLEGQAATIARTAAEVIAGRALNDSPAETIDEAIGRALTQAARGDELRIFVNPAMAGEVEALVTERQRRDRRRLNLVVVPDSELARHDARIDWGQGELILSAETRADAVRREFEALFPAAE